jgi:hypothetical protein
MKILSLVLAQIACVDAVSNPSNHEFSLHRHISFTPDGESTVEGETEAFNFYKGDHAKNVLTSGEAPLSLFFHGGACNESFVGYGECAFVPSRNRMELGEEDESEDNEDDDQDDGHSSMLSNKSVQNSRVSNIERGNSQMSSIQKSTSLVNTSSLRSATRVQGKYDPLLLNVRGGAQVGDEATKRLIVAALVTLLYEGSLGHILEFLKIAMQTAAPGTTYANIIKNITSKKGIGGLWDGFIPWGVVQAVMKGGVFGLAHSVAKSYTMPLAKKGILPDLVALTIAGGIAGGFQGYVLSPTLLLKTRVMTNPVFREKMSLLRTTLLSFTIGFDVVKNEGLLALMKGSNIFAMKRVFDWSTRYFFSDMFESMMLNAGYGVNGSLSPKEQFIASMLGGYASTVFTLPLDVIVAKSQDAKKAGQKVSAWKTFMKDYEEGGWKGLYNANMMGFEARLAHVCLTTVVMKTGSGLMYNYLYGKK